MADPITIAAGVGMAGTAAGGLIGGLGAEQAGQASAAAYKYKAGVALLNKQINLQNAAWTRQTGDIQQEEYGMKARQEIAGTKVAQAASGLDVNVGTAASVRKSQTQVAQFDQNVIQWDAAKTAYGYEAKATQDVAESQLDTMAAEQAKKAGDISMWTSFLNAGSSVAGKWMQGKSAGAFG